MKWFNKKKETISDIVPKGIKKTYIPAHYNNIVWELNSKRVEDNLLEGNGKRLVVS